MSDRQKESAVVISQECIAPDIYSMWIHTEKVAGFAVPGQFISMYTKDGSKLLPRPISLCETDRQKGSIRVVYRVTGSKTGTSQFANLSGGDTIDILGPLGNGFPLDVTATTGKEAKDCCAMLIGGGIGVPPMLELAKQLHGETIMVMGYRDQQFLQQEFQHQGRLYVATEDGSAGTRGNVMDAIAENNLSADIIYACGPSPMLRAIKQYGEENNIVCYLSMEEKMACGIGACLACVCQSKEIDGHSYVRNKRVCKDGPVFLSTEVEI